MCFIVTKLLKLKQKAAISFSLQFLKYSLPAVLRGGSQQTTAGLGTCLETPPFPLVQWNMEMLLVKEDDPRNVTGFCQRGK